MKQELKNIHADLQNKIIHDFFMNNVLSETVKANTSLINALLDKPELILLPNSNVDLIKKINNQTQFLVEINELWSELIQLQDASPD